MSEHRKEERRKLTAFTPVYDLHKNILLGYLENLTQQGAMLVGNTSGVINEKVTLVIKFPETPEFPATRMTLPARVAWCKHEKEADYYNTGVEFVELSGQNKKVIEAILERYQFGKDLSD